MGEEGRMGEEVATLLLYDLGLRRVPCTSSADRIVPHEPITLIGLIACQIASTSRYVWFACQVASIIPLIPGVYAGLLTCFIHANEQKRKNS